MCFAIKDGVTHLF